MSDNIDELIRDNRKIISCTYPDRTCKKQFHSTIWSGENKGYKHFFCTKWKIVGDKIVKFCEAPTEHGYSDVSERIVK